ncbi:MAG: Phosphoenolpyruvate guanylyltransferase [Pseudomonadota bacterium]|jgi:rSAM/selenodomain-associated transferase 1
MTTRLIVFAKLPVPGRVKTRLAATVGEAAALDAHRRLFAATLALARDGAVGRRELRYDDCGRPPDAPTRAALEALADAGWSVGPQRGADLGARMREALEDALAAGDRAVLIGCDCPVLRPDDLAAAFAALDAHDAVLAPAEDGGYALVGLARPLPGLFDGIDWGTGTVLEATRGRLAAAGARWHELRTVWDVDVEADLARWAASRGAAS